jgi:glycosyltransferase involved in cell wall biosynthesis
LADAVRSLVEQEPLPEVVVVNSGGGDPATSLANAGLEVPVIDWPERLFAGAARNRGIAATSARYVAFLAADSVAEPGWVAGRLRHHAAGADAVACVMASPPDASRSARAAHLLLNNRRMADTPPEERLYNGLSYDRALFTRFGLFREDLRVGEDSEFNARLEGSATLAWAPEVRTRHEAPSRPRDLLRDQYARGRRRVVAERHLSRAHTARRMAAHARVNVRLALQRAGRTSDQEERARLIESWPLIIPGALSYLAGSITAASSPDSRAAGRQDDGTPG